VRHRLPGQSPCSTPSCPLKNSSVAPPFTSHSYSFSTSPPPTAVVFQVATPASAPICHQSKSSCTGRTGHRMAHRLPAPVLIGTTTSQKGLPSVISSVCYPFAGIAFAQGRALRPIHKYCSGLDAKDLLPPKHHGPPIYLANPL